MHTLNVIDQSISNFEQFSGILYIYIYIIFLKTVQN